MKVLFITDECFNKSGGGTYTRALIQVFYGIMGKDDFYVYYPYLVDKDNDTDIPNLIVEECEKPNKMVKLFNMLIGKPGNFNKRSRTRILKLIKEKSIDTVVLSRSFYGGLCKDIKRKNKDITIITFFHDIIDEVIKEHRKRESGIAFFMNYPKLRIHQKNEHLALALADKKIVLNERDYKLFVDNYNKVPDAVIPIFTKDRFCYDLLEKSNGEDYILLFVGSYYWPNIAGIKWFIQNVMNCIEDGYVLYIVGRDLEKIKHNLVSERENVKIIGTVDNLDEWYYKADLVVGPIFEGSGMKTKTAEALMYGKIYLGTDEALCGFVEINDYCCNTADEFLTKIYKFTKSNSQGLKYSEYLRQVYEKNYSEKVMAKRIESVLRE